MTVRHELQHEFFDVYDKWFPSEVCDSHRTQFISGKGTVALNCQGCRARKLYEKRTPGLFKLEYEGEGMISLCSKTYHCFGDYSKTSTKGLSKNHNTLDKDSFMQVLTTKEPGGGTNTGFRAFNTGIYTYTQHRNALSYFYIKRQVHSDDVTTAPLNI